MVRDQMSLATSPESSSDFVPRNVSTLLAAMTREEKASLLAGVDDWHFHGVPRLNIPSIRVTDCGHGVTLCGEESSPATCFPTGIGMAATWNEELLEKAGRVLGRETRALGCSILLGPKINLHRHPLNGRSFETFSEDPWLAGLLGAAVIRGIQAEGVGACVKAMTANNQQRDQEKVSSEVDERTLRELYLRAFELAVRHGGPCAIMTAYNRLNGVYCSESPWMIRQVIKDDWKFPGFVLSDWRAVHHPDVYGSGLDLEMPGPGKFYNRQAVLHALDEGLLTEDDLNDKAGRILRAILLHGSEESDATGEGLDTPENRQAALEVAEESIVLLKNDDAMLPLDRKSIRRILVTGPNAAVARLGGGGSASVTPFYSISPLDGIRELCGPDIEITHLEGCSLVGTMETITDHFTHQAEDGQIQPGLKAEFYNQPDAEGSLAASWAVPQVDFSWGWASPGPGVFRGAYAVCFSGSLTPPVSGHYRLGVYAQEGCVKLAIDGEQLIDAWDDAASGNFEEKYQTRYFTIEREFKAGVPVQIRLCYGKRAARAGVRLEWEMPGQIDSISRAVEAARKADVVIICAGLSNLFEGGSADRESIDIPAAQRKLIEAISKVNPRTVVTLFSGGVLSIPWASCVPAILQAWYPGQEGGRALARILFGEVNPSGRLPDTVPHELTHHAAIATYPGDGVKVHYKEGLFIGYRHFDRAGIAPHFPFGYGLSYTTFATTPPSPATQTISQNGAAKVSVRVKNTGPVAGQTVVQLYVRPIDPPVVRPDKELRAFRKISLAPGEEREISFSIGATALEYFSEEAAGWIVSPGRYEILIGIQPDTLQSASVVVY